MMNVDKVEEVKKVNLNSGVWMDDLLVPDISATKGTIISPSSGFEDLSSIDINNILEDTKGNADNNRPISYLLHKTSFLFKAGVITEYQKSVLKDSIIRGDQDIREAIENFENDNGKNLAKFLKTAPVSESMYPDLKNWQSFKMEPNWNPLQNSGHSPTSFPPSNRSYPNKGTLKRQRPKSNYHLLPDTSQTKILNTRRLSLGVSGVTMFNANCTFFNHSFFFSYAMLYQGWLYLTIFFN